MAPLHSQPKALCSSLHRGAPGWWLPFIFCLEAKGLHGCSAEMKGWLLSLNPHLTQSWVGVSGVSVLPSKSLAHVSVKCKTETLSVKTAEFHSWHCSSRLGREPWAVTDQPRKQGTLFCFLVNFCLATVVLLDSCILRTQCGLRICKSYAETVLALRGPSNYWFMEWVEDAWGKNPANSKSLCHCKDCDY